MKKDKVTINKVKSKVNRKGVHSKTKSSASKSSKMYVKPNVGQGRY